MSDTAAQSVVADDAQPPPSDARKEARDALKRARDAKNAKLRRLQKKVSRAKSVAELEELAAEENRDGGDGAPSQKPGGEAGAPVVNHLVAPKPVAPSPEKVAAFRPAVAGLMETLATLLEQMGPRWQLNAAEKESIVEPGALVAAKYLPEEFTTPEAALGLAVASVFIPRAMAELAELMAPRDAKELAQA